MTIDKLNELLKQATADLESAKANLYRLDGAISVLKHLIDEESKNATDSSTS